MKDNKIPEVTLKSHSKEIEPEIVYVPWVSISTPYMIVSDKDSTRKVWIKSKRKIFMYYAYQITRIKWFLTQYIK